MQIALIGWQGSGKSTLFKAVTGSDPTAGAEAHPGTAIVPDETLDRLYDLHPKSKKVNARVDYLDVVGLSAGQKKSGIKRSLVNHLQGSNVLAAVIGIYALGAGDSSELAEETLQQVEELETEMLLSDLATAEPRLERLEGQKKRGQKIDEYERNALIKCVDWLNEEKPLRLIELIDAEEKPLRGLGMLTQKPLLIVVNHGEDQDGPAIRAALEEKLAADSRRVVVLNAALEAEIASLDAGDREAFLQEMGIETPAADVVNQAGFSLLGLIRFFTVGDDECRAWPIVQGTDSVGAADTIHSDLARGFIRAEVVASSELLRLKSMAACRDQGVLRLEGKTYTVVDGDVVHIRFAI